VSFESARLAAYAGDCIEEGRPIGFLIKLADTLEDTPGCFLNLYSAEAGDSRNLALRPALELLWSSAVEVETYAFDIMLEYGRAFELPDSFSGGGVWAASFHGVDEYRTPTLQIRTCEERSEGSWRRAMGVFRPDAEEYHARVLAARDPVELGSEFEAEVVDTWILTGPAETRAVLWTFESPTGSVHEAAAEYAGNYRWHVAFTPNEPGTWRYRWTHNFLPVSFHSPSGEFHVRAESLEQVLRELSLLRSLADGGGADDRGRVHRRLYALEREGMSLLTPETYRSTPGIELKEAIRAARSALWGREVPDTIPLVSHSLISEVGGVPLRDPVPGGSRHGPTWHSTQAHHGSARGPVQRLIALLPRLRRRR
jgi:hypothetical protein